MTDREFTGTRLRRLREEQGLSQLALQRLAGVSQATIHRAEIGGVVSPRTAQKLAVVLKCDPQTLAPRWGRR